MRKTIAIVVFALALLSCGSDDGSNTVSCAESAPSDTFDACVRARTESDCLAACGSWHRAGLFPEPICNCPTGEAGEACTDASECLGACIAEPNNLFDCSDAQEGMCADVFPTFGCWCWFNDGEPQGICAD